MKDTVISYIKKKYDVSPEYPWAKYDDNAVFRHGDNRKWFALIMDVRGEKVGADAKERIPVINLKVGDPVFRDILVRQDGIIPAYHMNKQHWITVLLDGTVPEGNVFDLIDMSYRETASAKKKKADRPPKDWLIPSNPKYYDVIAAFKESEEIDWKQGAGIRTGDTVYLYVGAPVSAILYKCRVTETDIPYFYQDGNLTIRALMKIKLQRKYDKDRFTFETLKEKFGIYAVRGPRGVPNSLKNALEED